MKRFYSFFSFISAALFATAALADQPRPWEARFQDAATPVMEHLTQFHHLLLIVIISISVFVTLLLVYTCLRFRAKANPVPSKTSHNTLVEVIWTAVPILILVLIAIPSLRNLYYADEVPQKADMTLKVTGYQWYWGYEYPDNGDISFESRLVPDDQIKSGQVRLLEVDNRVVLPVDTTIRIQVTGADVIHSFAMPSFGVKKDAVPGRLNETWVRIEKPGVYRGQCSELCGVGHGFMPIVIEAVSKAKFKAWVAAKQKQAMQVTHKHMTLALAQ